MEDFPDFMKRAANRIARSAQATPGVEGYVFDGADDSQMAFWTCAENAVSTPMRTISTSTCWWCRAVTRS